ncbi:hypothetical protein [Microvirga arabica]|uniref:hypothetical protein n=1 Tax=Microvirga arabica TaxID=1128671 RepID=UPI0019398631|nr:hypothetical protein [Microvirga arabica]MBM1170094.1 hypothetical protein [Microvirga arabica]
MLREFDFGADDVYRVAAVYGPYGEEDLVPMRGRQVPGSHFVRRIFELDVTDGIVYRARLGLQVARYFLARGGDLVRIPDAEVADLVDPAGKRMRDTAWQARMAGLNARGEPKRFAFDRPHGLSVGDMHVLENGARAVVTKATARQAWLRPATLDEIDAYEQIAPGPVVAC